MKRGVRCMPTSNRGSAKRAPTSLPESRAKKRLSAEEIDGWRWTEDGIHQWWQQLKARARLAETRFINDIDLHDLRHDFAHRARAAGWSLEEVAYYQRGMPAIQTTIRYTQVGRKPREREAEAAPRIAPNAPNDTCLSKNCATVRRGLRYENNHHQTHEHARYCVGAFH